MKILFESRKARMNLDGADKTKKEIREILSYSVKSVVQKRGCMERANQAVEPLPVFLSVTI